MRRCRRSQVTNDTVQFGNAASSTQRAIAISTLGMSKLDTATLGDQSNGSRKLPGATHYQQEANFETCSGHNAELKSCPNPAVGLPRIRK